jgi:hypothetical protein
MTVYRILNGKADCLLFSRASLSVFCVRARALSCLHTEHMGGPTSAKSLTLQPFKNFGLLSHNTIYTPFLTIIPLLTFYTSPSSLKLGFPTIPLPENRCGSGLILSSGILNIGKHNILENETVSVFRWVEGNNYFVGSVRKSWCDDWGQLFLRDPNREVFLPSPEDGNRSSFRNILFPSILHSGRWTKSTNPAIQNVIKWNLDSSSSSGILEKNDGHGKRTDVWAYIK